MGYTIESTMSVLEIVLLQIEERDRLYVTEFKRILTIIFYSRFFILIFHSVYIPQEQLPMLERSNI